MQETGQSLEQSQSTPSTLFLGISKQVLNKQSRFRTLLLLVPMVFKPAKGFIFLVLDIRAGVSSMWFRLLSPREDL